MINFLQINLNCCRAAQALVSKTADDLNSDFILVSEQNQNCDDSWTEDLTRKSAIVAHSNHAVEKKGVPEQGFIWIRVAGIDVYSCYWPPSSDIGQFEDFTRRLESSIRGSVGEVLLCGDFNAHHTSWGCNSNDKKGEILADMIHSLGMITCNHGSEATFQRGNRSSIVDVTFATPCTAASIQNWKVVDVVSLSDHNYIAFSVQSSLHVPPPTRPAPKLAPNKLTEFLASNPLPFNVESLDVEAQAETLSEVITRICSIPSSTTASRTRKSVYWWCPALGALRKEANHLRRVHQRKRKKFGEDACATEADAAKFAKATLSKGIKDAKKRAWKDLCDQVQRDPWGKPYKLVMGKLCRKSKIPEIDTPGRIDMIIGGLFPEHAQRPTLEWPLVHARGPEITLPELQSAACQLKNCVAPGPDKITNEIIKIMCRAQPDVLLAIYNKCVEQGRFPHAWKRAKLVLLRKGSKPLDVASSYRPLCLLDSAGKLFEKILDNRIRDFLEASNGIAASQFGFRRGRSTVHAVNKLVGIVNGCNSGVKVGVLTFDIKNAFNSASWERILHACYNKDLPIYLCKILDEYFNGRQLQYTSSGAERSINVTSGVPQGSVLGPTLWNVLYDGLLRLPLPEGVEFLAYADDLALIGRSKFVYELEASFSSAAESVRTWLENAGLKLAIEKSEAIILTNTRTHNEFSIQIGDVKINGKKCIKYLGMYLNPKLNFTEHAMNIAEKAGRVANNLARIMPNISAARPKMRKLLACVAHSIILYGAPVWASKMSHTGIRELAKVQRRTALRVASAYRTVSTEALLVIADMPPIEIMATERKQIFEGVSKTDARKNLMATWQARWDTTSSDSGPDHRERWTHRLIPDITKWSTRNYGSTDFWITQVLSNHGCFAAYLYKIKRISSPLCWFCELENDDAEHTMFRCDAWEMERRRASIVVGGDLTPENMVTHMLESKEKWDTITNFIHGTMKRKESEERRRQLLEEQI